MACAGHVLIRYTKIHNGCYQPKELTAIDINDQKAYFVISGKTQCNDTKDFLNVYLTTLFSIDLYHILLGNMAAHPQYTGNTLLPYRINPFSNTQDAHLSTAENWRNELFDLQLWARQQGCCLENPSLVFIEHIFYARMNELKFIHAKEYLIAQATK